LVDVEAGLFPFLKNKIEVFPSTLVTTMPRLNTIAFSLILILDFFALLLLMAKSALLPMKTK
jgi:hypothetical protein